MGSYNQPTVIPYQPSFLERIAPQLVYSAAQFGMQKLGQDWKEGEAEIQRAHEKSQKEAEKAEEKKQKEAERIYKERAEAIKGVIGGTLAPAKEGPYNVQPPLAPPPEQVQKGPSITLGNKDYEVVPWNERIKIEQITGPDGKKVNVLVGNGKASIIPEEKQGALTLGERKELETHKAKLKPGKTAKPLTKDDVNKRLLSLEQAKLKIQTTKGLDPLTMFLIKDNPDAQAAYKAGDTSAAIAEIDGQIAYYQGLRDSKGLTLPKGLTEEDIKFNMTKYSKTRAEVVAAYLKNKK